MRQDKRAVFAATVSMLVLGCGKLSALRSGSDGGAASGAAGPTAAVTAVAPCIAGKWDAKDLSSKIKSSIKSAANAGLTPVGGTITYDFSAPAADGKGVVTVTVTSFVTKMALSQGGVNINGTITLSGPAEMPYTLGPGDALTIAAPTKGRINAHADVNTSGIVSTHNTEDSAVDLSGAFVHECAGDKLTMSPKSSAGKPGATLVFTRLK